MSTIPELFGSMVFDDKVMRARLSADVYHSLKLVPAADRHHGGKA